MFNCMLVLAINAIIMIFCGVTFLHINVALIWVYLFLLTILSIFDIILYKKKYIKSNKSIRRNYNLCFSGIYLLLKVFIINTFSDFASELPLLEMLNFIKVILFALADYCMIRTLKEYSKRLIVGHMILQFVIMCVVRLIMVANGYAATGIIAENLLLSMMPMAMFGLLKR